MKKQEGSSSLEAMFALFLVCILYLQIVGVEERLSVIESTLGIDQEVEENETK